MWRSDIRPAAVAWFLGATLLAGLALRGYRAWQGEAELPQRIIREPQSETAALFDSIAESRRARLYQPVDINTASAAEFERLRGIGPVLAKSIVEDRERHGRFTTIDELTRVTGIGPKRLDAIRDQCIVDSQVTSSPAPP